MKNSLYLIGLGVGGTLLYQQVKSGNFRKMIRSMNKKKTKTIEELEDML